MKRFFLMVNALVFCFAFQTFAQEYAVDKGAVIVGGNISFSSSGGDLFENLDGDKTTDFTFSPGANFFVAPNFFVGGAINYTSSSVGDFETSSLGIGPNIGYAFGNSESATFPYLAVALFYNSIKVEDIDLSGTNISLSGGVLVPVKDHIGINFGVSYNMLNLNVKDFDASFDGNIFNIMVGINGLIF